MAHVFDVRRPLLAMVVIAALLATSVGCSTSASGKVDRVKVQELVQHLVDKGAVAAVVQVRSGADTVDAAAGTTTPGGDTKPDPQAPVRVASITKAMVAVVVLHLVDERQLSLDDPVSRYVPGVATPNGEYTVRHLLNHTSGVGNLQTVFPSDTPSIVAQAGNVRSDDELIAIATTKEPWAGKPGERFSYSNANYLLAVKVAEKVTGRPMTELITERVFRRAGMDRTLVPRDHTMPAGALPGYLRDGDQLTPLTEYTPTLFSWGANVVSTTGDLNKFFRAVYDGTLLSPERAEEMRSGPGPYKLGLLEFQDGCGLPLMSKVYGNRGNGLGYGSMSFHSADGQRQVSIAWTGTGPNPPTDPLVTKEATVALMNGLGATC